MRPIVNTAAVLSVGCDAVDKGLARIPLVDGVCGTIEWLAVSLFCWESVSTALPLP